MQSNSLQSNSCRAQLWIGFGGQRGVSSAGVAVAIQQVCAAHGLDQSLIIGIATLNSKATEAGLLDLCAERQWAVRYFSAAQLRSVQTPHPVASVMAAVATPSVAEAAAILAAQSPLWVAKQIIRQPDQPAITIAIAPARLTNRA